MKTSLSREELFIYINKQINIFFPDEVQHVNFKEIVDLALSKVEYCFSFISLKHYYKDGAIYFNHLNSDQYTVFIYYASNIAYEIYNDEKLASKLFYLNKSFNQFHCMYSTKLPDIFVLIHSSGIILGKARYSDFLVVSHHCTVGANAELEYPKINKYTIMYPYSSIVGNSNIDPNVCLSNGAYINDEDIDSNKIIFDRTPNLIIKNDKKNRIEYFFKNYRDINEK